MYTTGLRWSELPRPTRDPVTVLSRFAPAVFHDETGRFAPKHATPIYGGKSSANALARDLTCPGRIA